MSLYRDVKRNACQATFSALFRFFYLKYARARQALREVELEAEQEQPEEEEEEEKVEKQRREPSK